MSGSSWSHVVEEFEGFVCISHSAPAGNEVVKGSCVRPDFTREHIMKHLLRFFDLYGKRNKT